VEFIAGASFHPPLGLLLIAAALQAAVASARAQTWPSVEIIVVDDARWRDVDFVCCVFLMISTSVLSRNI
jgi:hypothetical protein